MNEGYYLSTYLYINKLGHLTKTELRHDMSLCLWYLSENKLKLIRFWELERFTGYKQHRIPFYDKEHAIKIINELLSDLNLGIDDMQAIWGTPELDTSNDYTSLGMYPNICYHSICHLFSSLLSDSKKFYSENILSFAVDGAPDNVIDEDIECKEYYCGSYSEKGEIKSIFPVFSPGIHWGYARYKFKMREGSLMALASASTATIVDEKLPLISAKNKLQVGKIIDSIDCFYDKISKEDYSLENIDPQFTMHENIVSASMKEIQNVSIQIMEQNIEEAIKKFNINPENTYLSLSGGYALNCPTNSYLLNKYKFKGLIAPPFVNEVGQSIGVGIYAFYKKLKGEIVIDLTSPFLGKDIEESELNLLKEEYSDFIESVRTVDDQQIVEDLENSIIVWMEGRTEVGPRALGHRSLIGDPRSKKVLKELNKIKQRQWWRPVAPIVLENHVKEWFQDGERSEYMLRTFKLKDVYTERVPAIVHLDQSARVQTVNSDFRGKLYSVIESFYKKTGVPIICNTSLNDAGEPIINTVNEMMNFALRKKIPIVYINGIRFKLKKFNTFKVSKPAKREVQFELFDEDKKESLRKKLNPYNVSKEDILVYVQNPKLLQKIDITTPKGVEQLERIKVIRKNRFHVL